MGVEPHGSPDVPRSLTPDPHPPTGLQLSPDVAGDSRLLERLLSGVSCSVMQAGWYCFPPDWSLPERVRPTSVLFVGVGGRSEFVIGGQRQRLVSGDILLTPPQVPQEGGHDPADPLRMYTVHFVARLYGVLDMPALYGLPVALRPAPATMARIVEAARRIVDELARGEAGCALAANGECATLLALLWRETVGQAGSPPPDGAARAAEVARLAPVFRTIQARYAERLTLEDLARVVHLHPAYFSALFKRVTGLPPLEYLARYRLHQARDLLLSTDRSIREIARATGYRDPFYLSRVFRRAEGMSPSEYRRDKTRPALP